MGKRTESTIDHMLSIEIPHNDLVSYLEIIVKLQKRYGKNFYHPKILSCIKDIDKETYILLHETQKLTTKDIQKLIIQIKKTSSSYVPTFTICTPRNDYKKALEEQIGHHFTQYNTQYQEDINLWVTVSWEWRYYKRNIDQDIQKLLD